MESALHASRNVYLVTRLMSLPMLLEVIPDDLLPTTHVVEYFKEDRCMLRKKHH